MQDLVNRRVPQPPSRIPPHDQSTRRSPEVYQSVQLPEAGGMMAVDADVFRSDDKRDDKRDESSEVPSRFFSAPRRIAVWVTMWLLAVRAPEVLTHSTQAARDKTITHGGWRYQAVHCIICVSGAPQLQVTRPPAFTCWAGIPTVGRGRGGEWVRGTGAGATDDVRPEELRHGAGSSLELSQEGLGPLPLCQLRRRCASSRSARKDYRGISMECWIM
jgi:hypothetical protein